MNSANDSTAKTEPMPLCDVVGCTDDCLASVDGIAHCERHLFDMWDRWQAFEIWPAMREHIEPIRYRQDPGESDYRKQLRRLHKAQNDAQADQTLS